MKGERVDFTLDILDPQKAAAYKKVNWEMAACIGKSDIFFSSGAGQREGTRRRKSRELQAKIICYRCPIKIECLEYAIMAKEPVGVWGQLTPQEREETRNFRKELDKKTA